MAYNSLGGIVLLIFLSSFTFSQPEFSFRSLSSFSSDSAKFSILTYGDALIHSPSLNNRFFHQFNKNGYITTEIKDNISQNLTAQNFLGADLSYGLAFSHKLNPRMGYFIHLSDKTHLDGAFSKDFFDLAFYGNKKFAGSEAILDNTEASYLRYQQLQAGITHRLENGMRYGAALSVLKGEETFSMKLNKARLYTDKNGEMLEADFNAEIFRSDTASKGMSALNGWGISTDAFIEFPFKIKERTTYFRLETNDAGIIRWNNESLVYKGDTSLQFEGIKINDIFQLNDSVLKSVSPDTITGNLQSSLIKQSYNSRLPVIFRGRWDMETEKYLLSAGAVYRLDANFAPLAFIKAGYKFMPFFSSALRISSGGYGNLSAGVELNFRFNGFHLLAGCHTVEGIFLPDYSAGNSGFLTLKKEF